MYRQLDDVFELKNDIIHLKKELASYKDENLMLKVKLQRLCNEISRKNKAIDALIDPRKSAQAKRVISEREACMIINVHKENDKLTNTIAEKDSLIRRLQNELQMKKVYGAKTSSSKEKLKLSGRSFSNHELEKFQSHSLDKVEEIQSENIQNQKTKSANRHKLQNQDAYNFQKKRQNTSNIKGQYDGLTKDQLLSIIENGTFVRQETEEQTVNSPHSDVENFESQREPPHDEICQLQNYYMEMVSEVDCLKYTITQLRREHENTAKTLKKKDISIKVLANEIEQMKKANSLIEAPNGTRIDKLIVENIKVLRPSNITKEIAEETIPDDITEESVTYSTSDVESLLTEKNQKVNVHKSVNDEINKRVHTESCIAEQASSQESNSAINNQNNIDEIRRKKFNMLIEEMKLYKNGS